MNKAMTILALVVAASANPGWAAAQATATPDLKGHWVATSDAIRTGQAQHHAEATGTGPQVDHIEVIYDITNQDGKRFWGTVSFKEGPAENIIGVIGFDGKTLVARDSDGLYEGTIVDADTMDVIYSHANSVSTVVAAHRFTRKK